MRQKVSASNLLNASASVRMSDQRRHDSNHASLRYRSFLDLGAPPQFEHAQPFASPSIRNNDLSISPISTNNGDAHCHHITQPFSGTIR